VPQIYDIKTGPQLIRHGPDPKSIPVKNKAIIIDIIYPQSYPLLAVPGTIFEQGYPLLIVSDPFI
jgi:hypothetical protein